MYGWQVIAGSARFGGNRDAQWLEVASALDGGRTRVEAAHYLVATGSAPWVPPASGLHGAGYLTSATAMEMTGLLKSIVVIGGNAVGLELGQLFARLATRVTVVEVLDRLAPFDEPEVSTPIEDALESEGVCIVTGATVTGARKDGASRSVFLRTAGDYRPRTPVPTNRLGANHGDPKRGRLGR